MQGIGFMASRYCSKPAYKTYLKLGKIKYPCPAPDHLNMEPGFLKWKMVSSGSFYQGYATSSWIPNGRGVRIEKGGLFIGHEKFGKAHGGFVIIRKDGTLQIGICKEDKAAGTWLVVKPNINTFSLSYIDGNLI